MIDEIEDAIKSFIESCQKDYQGQSIPGPFVVAESNGKKIPPIRIPGEILNTKVMYEGLSSYIDTHNVTTMCLVSEAWMRIFNEDDIDDIAMSFEDMKNVQHTKKEVITAVLMSKEKIKMLYWDIARIKGEGVVIGKAQEIEESSDKLDGGMKVLAEKIRLSSLFDNLDW